MPAFVVFGTLHSAQAAIENLNNLKITEVVQSVTVTEAVSKRQKPAQKNATFNVPDILTTGPSSRAEMVAADGTVTRVGSNTVFSFSPDKREVNLEKGCVLFHSPTGKGGGTIRSAAATASVLGTSIIVTATRDGGFKLLVLEGKAKAALANGRTMSLTAGQLTFIMPGSKDFGPVIAFRLKEQVGGSNLVKGFKEPLASLAKIEVATVSQEQKIATGKIESTNLVIADTQVLETKVVDTTLIQTRANVAAEVSPFQQAANSDAVVASAPLPASRLFSSTGASIPSEQLKLASADFSRLAAANPSAVFESFVGKNISITAPYGTDLTNTGVNSYEFAFVAKEAFTQNQGLTGSQVSSYSARSQMDSLLSAVAGKRIALIAGKSISLLNTVLAAKAEYVYVAPSAGSSISITLSNAAILNAGGNITFDGTTFVARDASLLAASNVNVYAATIDISSAGLPGDYAAGYAASGYTSAAVNSGLNFIASNLLSITNARLGGASINLQGTTLNLASVDFKSGSTVQLVSRDGQYSTTSGVTGSVNDVGSTVTYNGLPIIAYDQTPGGSEKFNIINPNVSILSAAELALDGTVSKSLTIDGNPNFLAWLYNKRTFALTGAQLATQAGSVFGSNFTTYFGTTNALTSYTVYAAKDITLNKKTYGQRDPYDANRARFVFLASNNLTADFGASPFGVSGTDTSISLTAIGNHLTQTESDNPTASIAKNTASLSNFLGDSYSVGNIYGLYGITAVSNLSNVALINGGGFLTLEAASVNSTNSSMFARGNVSIKGDSVVITSTSPRDYAAGFDTAAYTTAATGSVLSINGLTSLSITNARLGGANIQLTSPSMSLTNVTFKSGSSVSLSGANIFVQSPTLDLQNVNFASGSTVKLVSTDGQYSTTAGVTGSVNDVGSTVTYNGAPIITYNVLQADGNNRDILNGNISIWSTAELALDGTMAKALTIDAKPNFLSWLVGNRLFSKTGAQIAADTAVAAAMGSSFVSFFNPTAPTNNSTTLYDFYIGKDIALNQKAYRMNTPYDAANNRFVLLASNNITANFSDTAFTGAAVNGTSFGNGGGLDRPTSFIARNAITGSNWLIDMDSSGGERFGLYGVTAAITFTNSAIVNYGGPLSLGAASISLTDSAVIAKGDVTVAGDTVSLTSTLKRDYAAGWNNTTALFSGYTPVNGSVLDITGNTSLSITNANLGGKTIKLTSPTINLSTVEFKSGSTVTLTSTDGEINTGATSVAGKVNFLTGVTYGGATAYATSGDSWNQYINPNSNVIVQTIVDAGLDGSFSAAYNSDARVSYRLHQNRFHLFAPANYDTALKALIGTTRMAELATNFGSTVVPVFVGNNIYMTFPDANVASSVNLTGVAYQFLIAAQNSFTINSGKVGTETYFADPLTFMEGLTSLTVEKPVAFVAGTSISLLNTVMTAKTDDKEFYSNGGITLNNFAYFLQNDVPNSQADLRFNAVSTFSSTNSSLVAGGDIEIKANNVNITSTRALGDVYAAGWVTGYDSATLLTTAPAAKTLSVYATNDLTVNNMRLGAGNITLDATTISLKDVDFKSGSVVVMRSADGGLAANPNTNKAVVPRTTNFISGVKYGGAPITTDTSAGGKITYPKRP